MERSKTLSKKSKFTEKVQIGQLEAGATIKLGMERVERRSKKYYNLFMLLPVVGNIIFYKEGLKEMKEKGLHK